MLRSFRRLVSPLNILLLTLSLAPLAMLAGCSNPSDSTKSADGKSAGASGSNTGEQSAAGKFDTGRAVLEAMATAYRQAQSYQDNGTVRLFAQSGDKKIDETHDFAVAFERPNKIHLDVYTVRVRSDGRKYHAFITDMPGQIVEKDAPAKLDPRNLYGDPILLRTISMGGPAGAPPQPLLLLEDKALQFILQGAEEPILSEPGEIAGRKCFRVQIPRPRSGVMFWIDQETFVLRRIALSTEALRADLAAKLGGEVENSSLIADFTGAGLDRPVKSMAFDFEVPHDDQVRVTPYFVPAHPGQLAGKKTPAFKFTDDEGKSITPESLTGKVAAMLFWSPQQGDSAQSMLDLQKIFDGYKDEKGVAIFTVCLDSENLDKKAMEDMRKSMNLTLPIYRDLEKNTPDYKFVDVVFILGPYGTVQDYELVADANLLATLQKRIESVLAGQSIAAEAIQRYQRELKDYEKAAEAFAKGEAQPAPQVKLADRGEPKSFKLTPLWKCAEVKDPGNILVLNEPKQAPRLLVVSPPNKVTEVGLDGKVAAVHQLNLTGDELIMNLRAFTTAAGKTYIAAFAGGQQRMHLFNLSDKQSISYPPDALQNPHSGIADVELFDLDGDGAPEIYVGFAGVVGVHAVALDGKRLWGNRSLAHVARMGAGPLDSDGRRNLICTNFNDQSATLAVLNAAGQRQGDFTVGKRIVYCFLGAELQVPGDLLWCGLSSTKAGENLAVGFNLQGQELWRFDLPGEPQPRPIEPIVAGRVVGKGPGQWILPRPDGSIQILAADGAPLDSFNYGAVLQGIAATEIGGKAALLIASPGGLEAFTIE